MKVDELEEVLGRLNAATPMIAASTKGLVAAQVVAVDDLKILVGAIASLRAAQPRIPEQLRRTLANIRARHDQMSPGVDPRDKSCVTITADEVDDLEAGFAALLPEPVDGMSQEPNAVMGGAVPDRVGMIVEWLLEKARWWESKARTAGTRLASEQAATMEALAASIKRGDYLKAPVPVPPGE